MMAAPQHLSQHLAVLDLQQPLLLPPQMQRPEPHHQQQQQQKLPALDVLRSVDTPGPCVAGGGGAWAPAPQRLPPMAKVRLNASWA